MRGGSWRWPRPPRRRRCEPSWSRRRARSARARFDVLLAGDCVPHKKPAPDIYLLALERLGVEPAGVLVIEDSRNGLEAAHAAGLRCVITVNGYTAHEDFREAVLVVSSLGDPGGERTVVIANRSPARPRAYITLADLKNLVRRGDVQGQAG